MTDEIDDAFTHWQEPSDDLAPRRVEIRRAADALRRAIERMVSTQAPLAELIALADDVEATAERLERFPGGRGFGWAEAANAGDPHAFFDQSPLMGKGNPIAPPLDLEVADGMVRGTAVFHSAYEGPPGCVHGGFVAAAFDEVLGMVQSLGGQPGMTGTLTVRYRAPTPLHTELRFEAVIDRIEGRKTFTSGQLYAGDMLCAEAEAVFIAVGLERMRQLAEQRDARDGEG